MRAARLLPLGPGVKAGPAEAGCEHLPKLLVRTDPPTQPEMTSTVLLKPHIKFILLFT